MLVWDLNRRASNRSRNWLRFRVCNLGRFGWVVGFVCKATSMEVNAMYIAVFKSVMSGSYGGYWWASLFWAFYVVSVMSLFVVWFFFSLCCKVNVLISVSFLVKMVGRVGGWYQIGRKVKIWMESGSIRLGSGMEILLTKVHCSFLNLVFFLKLCFISLNSQICLFFAFGE